VALSVAGDPFPPSYRCPVVEAHEDDRVVAHLAALHRRRHYIDFAMAFSFFVEILNLRIRKSGEPPAQLHQSYVREG
jgi:hypothetical protein